MRFILSIIAVLLVPVLTLAHRIYFRRQLEGPLKQQISDALASDPDLRLVKPALDYLDVTLEDFVPNLKARARAEELIRRIGVVRMLPENNHLLVPAHLDARRDDRWITLTGYIRDESALREVTQWLKDNRPSANLDTSQVTVSPFVTRLDMRQESPSDTILRSLSSLLASSPRLKISRNDQGFEVSGLLPDKSLRDEVSAALGGTRSPGDVDCRNLVIDSFARKAPFINSKGLPEFLKRYFSLADSTSIEADEHSIRFAANVTEEMYADWKPLLDQLGGESAVHAQWHIFPSVYHLPDYQPESKLDPPILATLREALRKIKVHFEGSTTDVTTEEIPKINVAAQAFVAAGPNARLVICAFADPAGDPKINQSVARRRADDVLSQFVDRGLPATRLQSVVVSPGSNASAIDFHDVELLVK